MSREWMADAACKDYPTDLFFPAKGGTAVEQVEYAKAICASCFVLQDCRDFILADHPRYEDDYGIYAGLTPEDRHRVRFDARNKRQRDRRRQRKHYNS